MFETLEYRDGFYIAVFRLENIKVSGSTKGLLMSLIEIWLFWCPMCFQSQTERPLLNIPDTCGAMRKVTEEIKAAIGMQMA